MRDLYEIEPGRLSCPGSLFEQLENLNIDDRLLYIDVRNHGQTEFDNAAYSHHVSGRAGVILVNEIHRIRDTAAIRLWQSEIAWQSFLNVSLRRPREFI